MNARRLTRQAVTLLAPTLLWCAGAYAGTTTEATLQAASQQLTQVVGQVAEASRQQSDAAIRIAPLLQQVQADSSHNAERVGQVSVSTQALDEMARALHDSLTRFQVDQQAA